MSVKRTILFFRLGFVILISLSFGAPIFLKIGMILPALISYLLFLPICHRKSGSSYLIFGQQMGCCARCIGIYVGLLLGSFIVIREKWKCLLLLLPIFFDWTMMRIDLYKPQLTLKTLTGFLAGIGSASFAFSSLKNNFTV